jgi:hypothetical protein
VIPTATLRGSGLRPAPHGGFGRVGHRRVTLSHVSCTPSSNWTCGFSRIQLSDHLHPVARAASQADGSLSPPFGTADTVYTGTDSSSASEPTANCVDVCVGAITAAHSARPNRSDGRSGCCSRPEIGTPPIQDWVQLPNHLADRGATGKRSDHLAHPIPYVGTPSCAATCTATVSGVSGTRPLETRSPLPPWESFITRML